MFMKENPDRKKKPKTKQKTKTKTKNGIINFKSKLFHSMTVMEIKIFLKKLCLPLNREMLLLFLALYAWLTLGSILKRYSVD